MECRQGKYHIERLARSFEQERAKRRLSQSHPCFKCCPCFDAEMKRRIIVRGANFGRASPPLASLFPNSEDAMLTAYRSSLSLSATSIFRPPPLLASCKFLQGPTGLLLLRKRLKCTSEDLEDLTRSDHVLGGFYSQMVGSHLAVYFKKMLLPTATDGHPLFAWTNPLARVLDPSPLITAVSRQGTKEGIKFSYTPFVAPSLPCWN